MSLPSTPYDPEDEHLMNKVQYHEERNEQEQPTHLFEDSQNHENSFEILRTTNTSRSATSSSSSSSSAQATSTITTGNTVHRTLSHVNAKSTHRILDSFSSQSHSQTNPNRTFKKDNLYNHFYTRGQIEVPLILTRIDPYSTNNNSNKNRESSTRTFLHVLNSKMDFFCHIPSSLLDATYHHHPEMESWRVHKRQDVKFNGWIASFHSSCFVSNHLQKYSTPFLFPTTTTTAATFTSTPAIMTSSRGYGTQRLSIGCINPIQGLQNYIGNKTNQTSPCHKDTMGTLMSWIHYDVSGSQGLQVVYAMTYHSLNEKSITTLEVKDPTQFFLQEWNCIQQTRSRKLKNPVDDMLHFQRQQKQQQQSFSQPWSNLVGSIDSTYEWIPNTFFSYLHLDFYIPSFFHTNSTFYHRSSTFVPVQKWCGTIGCSTVPSPSFLNTFLSSSSSSSSRNTFSKTHFFATCFPLDCLNFLKTQCEVNVEFQTSETKNQKHPLLSSVNNGRNVNNSIPFQFPSINLILKTYLPTQMKRKDEVLETLKTSSSSSSFVPDYSNTMDTTSMNTNRPNRNVYMGEVQLQWTPLRQISISSLFFYTFPISLGNYKISLLPFRRTSRSDIESRRRRSNHYPKGILFCTLGIHHITWKSVSWLLRLDHEDISLSIPIQFHTILDSSSSSSSPTSSDTLESSLGGNQMLITMLQSIFIVFFSKCIHSTLRDVWNGPTADECLLWSQDQLKQQEAEDAAGEKNYSRDILHGKAYQTALSQIQLMRRKADSIRRSEEAIDGLVILKAWYYVKGFDWGHMEDVDLQENHIDVTTPLQFWVTQSKLYLAPISKSDMLGFCCLKNGRMHVRNDHTNEKRMKATKRDQGGFISWIVESFKQLFLPAWAMNKSDAHGIDENVLLYVRYKFDGKMYEITVHDDDELMLPSQSAREVILDDKMK